MQEVACTQPDIPAASSPAICWVARMTLDDTNDATSPPAQIAPRCIEMPKASRICFVRKCAPGQYCIGPLPIGHTVWHEEPALLSLCHLAAGQDLLLL